MLEQERIIEKLRAQCKADERLKAAMLYGSMAIGEGDQFSDVDCYLFFEEHSLAEVNKQVWVEKIGPVVLFYKNEFGNYDAVFDSLVRAEFHFATTKEMAELEKWQGDVYFPTAESAILVDKTGELSEKVQPLIGLPNSHDTAKDASFMIDSFFNWILYGFNLLGRGEHAHAAELLFMVQDNLLRMVRVLERTNGRWLVPTKLAEKEISAESYARYQQCTTRVEPTALTTAYWAAWEWGQELSAELALRHEVEWPEELADRLTEYFRCLM